MKIAYIRFMDFLERYQNFVLWLSVTLVMTSLAILPLSYSYINIKLPLNLLYIAFGIFIIFFYKDFLRLKALLFPLCFMGVVVIMAYISLSNAEYVGESKKAIRHYLLQPSFFMILGFLLASRLSQAQLKILFVLLCCVVFYHPLATLYDFYINGGGRLGYRAKLPHYHTPATGYVFYLLFAFSFAYIGFLKTKGILKIICGIFALLGIWAFVCNGGRFGILALITMICVPLVFFVYKRKKITLCALALVLILGTLSLYYGSANLPERFNFHKIINNFSQVWATPPAEMGKYLKGACDAKVWLQCSPHSFYKQSDIYIEYSSLDRISKLKATLLAIADNPLRPNGYHFHQFAFNILHIFPLDSINHPFSLTLYQNTFIIANAHNHNYPSSIFFELGLIGFVGFSLFVLYFPFVLYRAKLSFGAQERVELLFLGSIGVALVGLIVSNFF